MPEIKPIRIYKCDSCEKESKWTATWRSKTFYHLSHDEVVTVCSAKCEREFDRKRRSYKG